MNKITVSGGNQNVRINRHIYGHFSEHLGRCIYGGYWVGEDSDIPNLRGIRGDVVEALRRIKIPNLRWPGGCFADEYHWKDGIGPRHERPRMINTHWGGVIEDNSFGVHEFLDLCDQLSLPGLPRCEPYICGNVGSGTVQELSQWVEYCNFDGISPMADLRKKNGRADPWQVRYWGIGNENWGCGGQMTPEFYADNYKRYACYVRNYGGAGVYKIACGSHDDYYDWTRTLMEKTRVPNGFLLNGLSFHYYTIPGDWQRKGSATDFSEDEWLATMKKAIRMDELVRGHGAIMDEFDPDCAVGMIVDEWGTWYDVEPGTNPGFLYQQNSLRDALVAALHLNIFNNYSRRIFMANLAQTVNVLQSVILTDEARMILTPTYHVFDMYKAHQDAHLLPVNVESESSGGVQSLSASASMDAKGAVHISLVNIDTEKEQPLKINFDDFTVSPSSRISGQIITSNDMRAHNTFENPQEITLREFSDTTVSGGAVTLTLPPMSVVTLKIT